MKLKIKFGVVYRDGFGPGWIYLYHDKIFDRICYLSLANLQIRFTSREMAELWANSVRIRQFNAIDKRDRKIK